MGREILIGSIIPFEMHSFILWLKNERTKVMRHQSKEREEEEDAKRRKRERENAKVVRGKMFVCLFVFIDRPSMIVWVCHFASPSSSSFWSNKYWSNCLKQMKKENFLLFVFFLLDLHLLFCFFLGSFEWQVCASAPVQHVNEVSNTEALLFC